MVIVKNKCKSKVFSEGFQKMRINTSLSGGFQLNLFLHKICFRPTIFFGDNPLFLAFLRNLKYILV